MSCIFCFLSQQSVDTDCVSIPKLLLDHNCWFPQQRFCAVSTGYKLADHLLCIFDFVLREDSSTSFLWNWIALILKSIKFKCLVSIVQLLFIIWIWIGSASKRLNLVVLSIFFIVCLMKSLTSDRISGLVCVSLK